MNRVRSALAALDDHCSKRRSGFFTDEEWDDIYERWLEGISEGRIYDTLARSGRMPYKNERSFYRAFDNQKDRLHERNK